MVVNELIGSIPLSSLSCLFALILTEVLAFEESEKAKVSEVTTPFEDTNSIYIEPQPTIPRPQLKKIKRESTFIAVVVPSTLAYSCTGVLLTDSWVLTVAQCFHASSRLIENSTSIKVFVDIRDTFDWMKPTHEFISSNLIIHRHFAYIPSCEGRTGFYVNNVALIKVSKPFRFIKFLHIASTAWPQEYRGRLMCVMYGYTTFKVDEYNPLELSRKARKLFVSKPCPCKELLIKNYGQSSTSWACLDAGIEGFEPGAYMLCDGIIRGISLGNLYVGDVLRCAQLPAAELQDPVQYSPATHLAVVSDLCPYLSWLNSHVPNLLAAAHCSTAHHHTLLFGLLLVVIYLCMII